MKHYNTNAGQLDRCTQADKIKSLSTCIYRQYKVYMYMYMYVYVCTCTCMSHPSIRVDFAINSNTIGHALDCLNISAEDGHYLDCDWCGRGKLCYEYCSHDHNVVLVHYCDVELKWCK